MSRTRKARGSVASQLGFVDPKSIRGFDESSNWNVKKSSRSRTNKKHVGLVVDSKSRFFTNVLEQKVRDDMEEWERKQLKQKEKFDRLNRISFLYNMNPSSRNLLKAVEGPSRGKTMPSLFENAATREKKKQRGNSKKKKGSNKDKNKKDSMDTRQAWRSSGWSTIKQYDDIFVQEDEKLKDMKDMKDKKARTQKKRPKTAVLSHRKHTVDKETGICTTCAKREREAKLRRPKSANEKIRMVAGEIKSKPETEFKMLHDVTVMTQNQLSKEQLLEELHRPSKEVDSRKKMRSEVSKLFLSSPRIRVFSIKRLEEQLYNSSRGEPYIDRAGFVNAMRTTGLASNAKIFSRAFSSFDLDMNHSILIEEFIQYMARLQQRSKATIVKSRTSAVILL